MKFVPTEVRDQSSTCEMFAFITLVALLLGIALDGTGPDILC